MMGLEISEESSKKPATATSKTEEQPSPSPSAIRSITQTAYLNLSLDEKGSIRVCTPPDCAKQAAEVLQRLPTRDRELWCRNFTLSCVENILNSQTVDEETKSFFREQVEKRIKEQG
jgi:hypothetical protein